MSDHERGAYTPQPDAPLSFDPRVSRERRPLPFALIASCVVLATLVVALFLFYRSGVRGPNDTPTPVGAPIDQYKSAPPAATPTPAPAAPNALTVQTAPSPETAGTGLAPQPEQPVIRQGAASAPAAGRPAPATPVVDTTPPLAQTAARPGTMTPATAVPAPVAAAPVVPAPLAKPAPVKSAAVASAKATPPKPATARTVDAALSESEPRPSSVSPAKPETKPRPNTVYLAKAEPKPKPVATSKPPAKAQSADPVPGAVNGSAVVQIGAFLSQQQAKDGWTRVAGMMGGAISGKGQHIEPVQADGMTRYRSQVTGFATRAAAATFCASLKAKGHDCVVKAAN